MKSNLPHRLFCWITGLILYNADPEFLARSIGYRAPNSKLFWIKKNIIQLLEDGFGKEYFKEDYSDVKDSLSESDYLGIILKTNLYCDLLCFYLREIYRTNENQEFTLTVETYIKNNTKECAKLFFRIVSKKIRTLPRDIYASIVDLIDFDNMARYKKVIARIVSVYSGKTAGLVVSLSGIRMMNFFKPIINAFIDRGVPLIYIYEEESQRKNTHLMQCEGYFALKVKLSTSREVFKNQKYRDNFESDIVLLRERILSSGIPDNYKRFVVSRLKRHLGRYYKIRFFFDEFMKCIDVKFMFALPDRFDFHRTALMLCKKNSIRTFTYDGDLNTSENVLVWYFFSDWVLLSNKKNMDMIVEKGFTRSRVHWLGSTIADYYMGEKVERLSTDGVLRILLLTKPLRRTGSSSNIIIEGVLKIFERQGLKYKLYIKPHPADRDPYSRYVTQDRNKAYLINRTDPLYKHVPDMDILIGCGITGAMLECIPAKKPMMVIELSSNVDKKLFSREELRNVIPLFQNINDFEAYFSDLVNKMSRNIKCQAEIPQFLVDEFYYSLDGKTGERIADFVFSKLEKGRRDEIISKKGT